MDMEDRGDIRNFGMGAVTRKERFMLLLRESERWVRIGKYKWDTNKGLNYVTFVLTDHITRTFL
jgi:hypothetical protein